MRRPVAPHDYALRKQLRILRRLSPADYKAILTLTADVLQRRMARIQDTPFWRGPERRSRRIRSVAWSLIWTSQYFLEL